MIAILLDLFWREPDFVQPDMANGICVRGLVLQLVSSAGRVFNSGFLLMLSLCCGVHAELIHASARYIQSIHTKDTPAKLNTCHGTRHVLTATFRPSLTSIA